MNTLQTTKSPFPARNLLVQWSCII